jgi:hypothetical protein
MATIERRLSALEQRHKGSSLGIRWFQQSESTAEVYYEIPGTPFYEGPQGYTRADLDALTAMGWQLIKVLYVSDWRITEAQ